MVPDSANADSPWSNLKVRQAAEYAIDRVAMAKAFGFGLTKAPYQLAMDDPVASIPNLQARTFDPNKAKQLLTEAGYPNGFDTQLICQVSSITNRDEIQAIKAYLETVGIRATVNYYETAKYYEYRNGTWHNGLVVEPIANGNYGNYNATLNNYFGRNAVTFLSLGKSDAFLSALDTSMASAYPEAALEQAACKAAFDDAMVIPFSQRITFWMLQPNNTIQDLGLETRHYDLFFNTDNAWFNN
jgi:ABC-type transport system substrate-binding protein